MTRGLTFILSKNLRMLIHMMIYGYKREDARIFVQDAAGNKVKTLHAGKIKPGKNEFSFHHDLLPLGIYDIYVCFDVFNDTILNVKINKSQLSKIDIEELNAATDNNIKNNGPIN